MAIVSDLSSHTGYLLRIVSNAVSYEFARRMAIEGVTVAEWVVLRSLYEAAPIGPTALARQMSMTKGAISKLSDRLLQKGLIARTDNSDDLRGHTLCLSAIGKKKVPILARIADENDAAFFACLNGKGQDQLRVLLRELIFRHELSTTPVD